MYKKNIMVNFLLQSFQKKGIRISPPTTKRKILPKRAIESLFHEF